MANHATHDGGVAVPPVKPAPDPVDPGSSTGLVGSRSATKEDSLSVLKALAEASAVFVALTFVGGWSYLASYYKTFGLNPLELDIPIPVVSTIAIYALYESVWPLFVAGALIVALAIVARRSRGLGRGWVVAALGVLLLTAATAGVIRGRQIANQDTLADSVNLPNVAFASKLKDPEPSYYFFLPVPGAGVGSMNLYVLSDSDLVGVHVQRGLDQNARVE